MKYNPALIAKLKKAVNKTLSEDREDQLAVVECASPLTSVDKNKMQKIVNRKIKYILNPNLLAGVKIVVGDRQLDMSLLSELHLWTAN